MKLLKRWLRVLSAGLVVLIAVDHTHAQFASRHCESGCTGCADPSCGVPDGCDSSGCDGCSSGGLFGGRGLGGGRMMFGGGGVLGNCQSCGGYDMCGPQGICGSCMMLGGGAYPGGLGPNNCYDFAAMNGDPMCRFCGYQGCVRCGWGLGLIARSRLGNLARFLLPYGEGGVATPRWFDLSAEAVVLKRERGPGAFNYSSLGAGSGIFVLDNNSIDMDGYRAGLGLQGNLQLGVATSLEAVYFGLNRWTENAVAVDNPDGAANLFSFISAFGLDPLNGFDDSDRSLTHTLNYRSELHNGEFNLRKRWAGKYRWFQGSWLMGIRYLDLDETLTFDAVGQNNNAASGNQPRFFQYRTNTRNSLTAFQVGGDLWLNVIPGIKAGVEAKYAIGGNQAQQDTLINGNSLVDFAEFASTTRSAYIAQLNFPVVYRLNYSWAFRGSYQLMYIDNLALAADNFNASPPPLILPGSVRNVVVNSDAEVFYSGFTAGAEFTW